MSDWREQNQLSSRLFERTRQAMREAMARGCADWPLPEPPLSDPDFPVRPPTDASHLETIAIALLDANRAAFDNDLEEIGEALVPHRLSLTADPARESRKWLERRGGEVAERALFARLEIMLAQALAPDAPDADRWWVAIALLNGLSAFDTPIARQQGYHQMESIALARPPGAWHGGAAPGPHLLDWQEGREAGGGQTLTAHEGGAFAAGWLLDRMEAADPPRPVLVEWLDLAMARGNLVEPLNILSRLIRMAGDGEPALAARIAGLLPRAHDLDHAGAVLLQSTLMSREAAVRCAVADALDEIMQRRGVMALELLDTLMADDDAAVVRIATGSLRLAETLDGDGFLNRCLRAAHHDDSGVQRRFAQTALRDCIQRDPADEKGLMVALWTGEDEVVRSRVRELLLHMVESHQDELTGILSRIITMTGEGSLDDFWRVYRVRHPEGVDALRERVVKAGP
jgi:hypothetical protein